MTDVKRKRRRAAPAGIAPDRAGARHPRPVPLRGQHLSAAQGRGGNRARQEDPRRRPGCAAGAGQAQPPLRHLRRQEVPEPRPAAHRPDRRGQRRPAHGGAEVRSRPGRQVHLVRRVVDPSGHPVVARPPGAHRARAAQSHRRPLAHHQGVGDPAPEAAPRADARKNSRRSPASRSMSCSRSPRSTPATSASTRRWIRKAIAR